MFHEMNVMHTSSEQFMQHVISLHNGTPVSLFLPDPAESVVPGVAWGRFEEALTPAFWAAQAWMQELAGGEAFGLGDTLAEEVAACLLGGYGAPAEVGLAAYGRVRQAMRSTAVVDVGAIEAMLTMPLNVGDRLVRYRFARQRSRQLGECLARIADIDEAALDDISLRDALTRLPGIGPKTASWVVRNRRASDEVAILDIHIVRACVHMGIFGGGATPASDYVSLESRFIGFCRAAGLRASLLDALMWRTMRSIGPSFAGLRPASNPSSTGGRSKGKTACPEEVARAGTI
ncbi:mll6426 [Mesorhizobium japonicum MAFF 303099]|uniref:Mll6426 protein n=2 Tax=Mesorhizobium japonicum TaxID=2066070 RepID=Q989H0_RHILO|nr:mll6426 [Mesorhizobium japonicum MAFF 303099]